MAVVTDYRQYPEGAYMTEYGNTCVYRCCGDEYAYDLDMAKRIPLVMVDFQNRLGEVDDYE